MKNKPLKHYKRKKFFYRFFMRKSPRSGAMFGLALMNMNIALSPFLVLMMVRGAAIALDDSWVGTFVFIGPFVIFSIIAAFSLLYCCFGLCRIFHNTYKFKPLCYGLGVGSWMFPPALGILLLPVAIMNRCWRAVPFVLAGSLAYGFCLFVVPDLYSAVFAGTACYLAALALLKENRKFAWHFALPLAVAWAVLLFFLGYNFKLQNDVKCQSRTLSQLVGRSIAPEDFRKRDAEGFPPDREPLKTLIKCEAEYDIVEYNQQYDVVSAKKKISEIERKYPEFIKAVDEFLQLPPHYVSHNTSGDLFGMHMPELHVFRSIANILLLKITAAPEDKQNVEQCNRNWKNLHQWSLKGPFYLSHLVAIRIEQNRLDALRPVIASGLYSKAEIMQFIGEEADLDKFCRFSCGDEATAFADWPATLYPMSVVVSLRDVSLRESFMGIFLKRKMPLVQHVQFLRDYRFALSHYIKLCAENQLHLDQNKWLARFEKICKHNLFNMSGMVVPYYTPARHISLANKRKMALLAAEVMEYRQQHGKLPEDLSFLPQIPLSKLDHKPLMYEKTREGFRIFSHTDKGEKPDEKDLQYSYLVRLPMVTGTIPQGVSYGK